jgi:hypothetical protein
VEAHCHRLRTHPETLRMPLQHVPPLLSVWLRQPLSLFPFLTFSRCLGHTERASGHLRSFAIAGVMVSAKEREEKFYPSHWKRRVVFVIVKKSGQPRLGFVHEQKDTRHQGAESERLSLPVRARRTLDAFSLCHILSRNDTSESESLLCSSYHWHTFQSSTFNVQPLWPVCPSVTTLV